MITQGRSLRRPSGGLKKPSRKKKLYERGSQPVNTKLGSKRSARTVRGTGGSTKQRLFQATAANVYNPETKKYAVAKIKTVSNNPANRYFTRANIITRGAILETELGRAKVTNRPGQDGVVNAILVTA
ncbi:30S ribosomal protein S8e [Candidatus Woesearchaeota archaeon]|nr:30S ribosomal protein S8e [Candidatus Woesearchaeota archaeon]